MNETRLDTIATLQKGLTPEDYIKSSKSEPLPTPIIMTFDPEEYAILKPVDTDIIKIKIGTPSYDRMRHNAAKKRKNKKAKKDWMIPRNEIKAFFEMNPAARQVDLKNFYGLSTTTSRYYFNNYNRPLEIEEMVKNEEIKHS